MLAKLLLADIILKSGASLNSFKAHIKWTQNSQLLGALAYGRAVKDGAPLAGSTFRRFMDDVAGQVFVFFILTVAAAEAAIGLAILVVLFRTRASINVKDLNAMRG